MERQPPSPGSPEELDLARRFAEAFAADDVEGVVALLTDDAWLSMPPARHEYHGPAAIGAFLHTSATWRAGREFQLVPTCANTQPAFGCYLPGVDDPTAEPTGVVLTLRGDRVAAITRFLDPRLPRLFEAAGGSGGSSARSSRS
jgi:hypothetical protein